MFRSVRHLWRFAALLVLAAAGFVVIRAQAVPEDFGEEGYYRLGARLDEKARPVDVPVPSTCKECHEHVVKEVAGAAHSHLECFDCHGRARLHAETCQAAKAAGRKCEDRADVSDLRIRKDRTLCLECHARVVGRPVGFPQIVPKEHLEEQEADDPSAPDVCFECHAGHDPEP